MFSSNGVSLADIAAVTGNNRNNDGMWGDGAWWIVILLIFGWGNNGWGGFGGNGNGTGYTDAAIQRGFDNQAVISKLDGISNGLCDGFYAMNNSMLTGFNGINTNALRGFMQRKVLIHEVCHAICMSYDVYLPIEQEEILCDFVATYGDEVFDIVDMVLGAVRRVG